MLRKSQGREGTFAAPVGKKSVRKWLQQFKAVLLRGRRSDGGFVGFPLELSVGFEQAEPLLCGV